MTPRPDSEDQIRAAWATWHAEDWNSYIEGDLNEGSHEIFRAGYLAGESRALERAATECRDKTLKCAGCGQFVLLHMMANHIAALPRAGGEGKSDGE